jgi:hypothetical protein
MLLNQAMVLIYILYYLTVGDYEKGAANFTFSRFYGPLNTTVSFCKRSEPPKTTAGSYKILTRRESIDL